MYFEKVVKVNNNGKVSGYHKRGKVENGKTTYFINDSCGDQEDVKRLSSKKHIRNALLDNNELDSDGFFITDPLDRLPTYLNPHYFNIRLPQCNHRAITDDHDFIEYCEKQTKESHYRSKHREIKLAIREQIHNQLDEQGFVDPKILEDFKWTVEHESEVGACVLPSEIEHWQELSSKYIQTTNQCDAERKHNSSNESDDTNDSSGL